MCLESIIKKDWYVLEIFSRNCYFLEMFFKEIGISYFFSFFNHRHGLLFLFFFFFFLVHVLTLRLCDRHGIPYISRGTVQTTDGWKRERLEECVKGTEGVYRGEKIKREASLSRHPDPRIVEMAGRVW